MNSFFKRNQNEQPEDPYRRLLLKAGFLASVACLVPGQVLAQLGLTGVQERSLSLLNTHTGEELRKLVYWQKGVYLEGSLEEISYVLRDHRTDEVHSIDPVTLDLMAAISRKVGATRPFEIISGYRSPESNSELRGQSRRVAKNSYHMKGMAVDLRLPGYPLKKLRRAALDLRMGGVGYYPKSNFVHVDSGSVRSW